MTPKWRRLPPSTSVMHFLSALQNAAFNSSVAPPRVSIQVLRTPVQANRPLLVRHQRAVA